MEMHLSDTDAVEAKALCGADTSYDLRDLKGLYAPDSRRGKAKRDLVNFVRTNLGLLPDQPIVSEHQSIWESSKPSLFTVTLK